MKKVKKLQDYSSMIEMYKQILNITTFNFKKNLFQ